MIRKLALVALAVTIPVALVTTVGSGDASAAFPPVKFSGNVSCNLAGTVTISPPATSTSTGPYVVTFAGKNSKCVGLYGTSLTLSVASTGQTVKLKKSTETFSFTVPASPNTPGALCNTLLGGGSLPPVNPFPINWAGSGGTIVPTTTHFPAGGSAAPGLLTWMNGPNLAGSSFAGTTDLFLGFNLVTAINDCSSAGISSLPANDLAGDNLMVGSAF
jgi:hypothetical protein